MLTFAQILAESKPGSVPNIAVAFAQAKSSRSLKMTVLMRRRKIADQGDLESVQFTMTAEDQLPELKIGQEVSVFDFSYEGRSGQLTVWHDTNRAAIDLGEGSRWGDWDESTETILLDDQGRGRERLDTEGRPV
jgi:hypothetical protein